MDELIINLDLTSVEKEALRVFLRLKQENAPVILVGAQQLANILEVSRPRGYAILTQLEEKGVLEKIERKGFVLTNHGNRVINELLHRTKILETHFHKDLGMDLTNASEEASNLVLHVSFLLIEILCDRLGKPVSCPHDIEIPHHKKHPDIDEIME